MEYDRRKGHETQREKLVCIPWRPLCRIGQRQLEYGQPLLGVADRVRGTGWVRGKW